MCRTAAASARAVPLSRLKCYKWRAVACRCPTRRCEPQLATSPVGGHHRDYVPARCSTPERLFWSAHRVGPSVAAMRICNPVCLPARINRCDPAQTPTGFAELICNGLPVLHSKSGMAPFHRTARLSFTVFAARVRRRSSRSGGRRAVSPTQDQDAVRHKMDRKEVY
jgi:hypothetical protein